MRLALAYGLASGQRNGRGTLTYGDGSKYVGQWLNDHMHGVGELYYGNGQLAYKGQWERGHMNGHGTLLNNQRIQAQGPLNFSDLNQTKDYWSQYDGQFADDRQNGFGTQVFTNGEKVSGIFKGGALDGHAVYTTLAGDQIEGVWSQNILLRQ